MMRLGNVPVLAKKQPMLQPAVPSEKIRVPGRKWLRVFSLWGRSGAPRAERNPGYTAFPRDSTDIAEPCLAFANVTMPRAEIAVDAPVSIGFPPSRFVKCAVWRFGRGKDGQTRHCLRITPPQTLYARRARKDRRWLRYSIVCGFARCFGSPRRRCSRSLSSAHARKRRSAVRSRHIMRKNSPAARTLISPPQ
jgi:hypothetical protein